MRGATLQAKARAVSRCLGVEVEILDGPLRAFRTLNPELDSADGTVRCFEVHYRLPSQAERALRQLHSDVYRARGEQVWRRQNGLCAMCGKAMPANAYEIDHKHGRGRGRSDRLEDLQAVCTGLNGCDLHRKKHGG